MPVEVPVLAREQRVDQMPGQFLEADDLALLHREELRDEPAVAVQYLRGKGGTVGPVYVGSAEVPSAREGKAQSRADPGGKQQQGRDEERCGARAEARARHATILRTAAAGRQIPRVRGHGVRTHPA